VHQFLVSYRRFHFPLFAMNIFNHIVLITGGSAGIGLALGQLLAENGNHVILTGRNKARLQQAVAQVPGATAIVCDVTEAAVVNVSSIVAFSPVAAMAGYGASKAALHAYSQALRHTLAQRSAVRVFELMPPLVDTEFSAEIGGHRGIPAQQVAEEFLAALQQDAYEIHVGQTAELYQLFRADPAQAQALMNAR
jgi:short-subunit dehydrogenase involved in D-alanine esterification of teichoic acids